MNQQPFILDFDKNHHAVLEPDHDQAPFHFHSRLLYAFVPKEEIDSFLDKHLHRTIGMFDTISFTPRLMKSKLMVNFSLYARHHWEHLRQLNF